MWWSIRDKQGNTSRVESSRLVGWLVGLESWDERKKASWLWPTNVIVWMTLSGWWWHSGSRSEASSYLYFSISSSSSILMHVLRDCITLSREIREDPFSWAQIQENCLETVSSIRLMFIKRWAPKMIHCNAIRFVSYRLVSLCCSIGSRNLNAKTLIRSQRTLFVLAFFCCCWKVKVVYSS